MAWLFVPGLGASNSGSISPLETPMELSVTLSGKPTPRLLSWRGWKTRPWISRLSGTISRPSMAARGTESWILSLWDIRVSLSASRDAEPGSKTPATSGPMPPGSYESASPGSCSSKTSPIICDWDFGASPKTYGAWVSRLRRECLERRKSARAIGGSGSSCWHTPKASIDKAGLPREQSRQDLQAQSIQWLTPNVPSGGRSVPPATVEAKGSTPEGKRTVGLESQTKHWTTPQTHDIHPGNATRVGRYGTKHGGANLTDDVMRWPTSHLDPPNTSAGENCWCDTPNCGQPSHKRKLNPLFVEWLMGFPLGWTGFEPVETRSYLSRQRWLLSCLLEI